MVAESPPKRKFHKILRTIVSITLFILLGLIVIFPSCSTSNKEFAYNEAVSHSYLEGSDLFETSYRRFLRGEYLTHAEYEAEQRRNEFVKDRLSKDTIRLREDFKQRLTDLNGFTPSPSAETFHKMLESYYQAVLNDYIPALKEYAALNPDDTARIDASKQKITTVYDQICDIETKMKEVQLDYMRRVGFEPK